MQGICFWFWLLFVRVVTIIHLQLAMGIMRFGQERYSCCFGRAWKYQPRCECGYRVEIGVVDVLHMI